MNKFLLKIKSNLITEKNIICVSNSGVCFRRVGIVFLVWNVLLAFWTSFATIRYFEMRSEILKKNEKIVKLESVKQKLLAEIVLFNKDITNIRNFLISLNKYDRFITVDESSLNKINNSEIEETNNVKVVLNRIKDNTRNLNQELASRINSLDSVREKLNFDNVQLVSYDSVNDLIDNEIDEDKSIDEDVSESIVLKQTLDNNINHLSELENFINSMPFSEPMQSFYISSKYGKRLDPFLKTIREHHGIDLVGSYMAKIIAPADGKVIFVGIKGGYGKTVVLEHEYGMKTLYGHLSDYNVKVGDTLKRGDVIGLQGNTGRSTGQHLHYEIIKNSRERYNPDDFINIGENFY
ncbi:MAG TPA: M23 family metallopeptidase [Rickettsiales bacterium]|nr:M23 family metallopeptidase [Rickettsiales bacterium]